MRADESQTPLRIQVSVVEGIIYTKERLPLKVTFVNAGGERLRLLKTFEPISAFFVFDLVSETGKRVVTTKEDILPQPRPQYLDLSEGEKFSLQADLTKLLPPDFGRGKYKVSVTYENQYGENCFKGRVNSMPIDLVVEISAQEAKEIAMKAVAIKLEPDTKVTVEKSGDQYIVTFGEKPPPGVRGADYTARVYVNSKTGKVEKSLVGS